MINLVPEEAKKFVKIEYWSRLIVLFNIALSIVGVVAIVLLYPSYVLLDSQLSAYVSKFTETEEMQAEIEALESELLAANDLVAQLKNSFESTTLSELIEVLDELGQGINVNYFEIVRVDREIKTIDVAGIASSRNSLSEYSKAVTDHPLFKEVNIPISNLAQGQNVSFQISVVPNNENQ
tara:strand:+ start:1486 stop:2025 length:540 start_codon:yes stop_codon:yes gene_type:complete